MWNLPSLRALSPWVLLPQMIPIQIFILWILFLWLPFLRVLLRQMPDKRRVLFKQTIRRYLKLLPPQILAHPPRPLP